MRRADSRAPMRVLVLSRSYPNPVMELLGLWVQALVRRSAQFCEVKVVSPVPYCPPLPSLPDNYARFRRVPRRRWDNGIEILHPRFLVGPGASTHRLESLLYHAGIRRTVTSLRQGFPFDLIHAHCSYPDGVAAARLARRYGVPFVITEQNLWGPWMEQYPTVCRRAAWAARQSACLMVVSEPVRRSIEHYTGALRQTTVLPDGVDGSVFLPGPARGRIPNQILFVGAIRRTKGVDVLLDAVRLLADKGCDVQLLLAGEAFYAPYRQEELRLKERARELRLDDRVRFLGKQPLGALVKLMQESAALVLPSRAESLGMVLVEALACGTPVVSTLCGGPEDIVNDRVGLLVPAENPLALAQGIESVLARASGYDPSVLRAYALQKFGLESVGQRLEDIYRLALREAPASGGARPAELGRESVAR